MPTFSPYSNNAFSSLPHLRLPFPSTTKTTEEAAVHGMPNSSGQKCRHHQSCPELDGINHWPKSPSFHISSSPSALSALSSQNPSSSTASFHSFSPSPGSPNVSHQSDFFLDQCPALLQQVPENFDLGMTPVRLSSLAASSSGHYMAIGSHCGALFLFNRRLGQAVKPLRTNYNEVATLLQFHSPSPSSSSDGRDQLAVGHQSGILVLLALPSEGNQRFSQHVQEEAHRGSPLTAICWSPDGHSLFSGDHSGLLLAIRADFPNDHFPVNFVASEPLPIRSITAGQEKLAFSTAENCKIVNWKSEEYELIGQMNFGEKPILGMAFDNCEEGGEKLTLLTGDGTLLICQNADGNPAHELGNILNNLDLSQRAKWPFTDFSGANANADPSGQSLVIWKDASLLFCRFMEGGFGMEIVDLRERIGDPNLQVVSICVPSQNELFLLANARRVFRLGRLCPASPTLTISPPAPASVPNIPVNIFGSLFAAGRTVGGELHKAGKRRAQGLLPTGTDQLLGKFNRELDIFLMGESGKNGGGMEMEEETEEQKMDERNVKDERKKDEPAAIGLAEKLAAGFMPMPEPAERLAQGLQQLFGQIRQSSSIISAEFDHWSLAGTSRDLNGDIGTSRGDNRSLPTELSPSMDEDREELISLLEDGSEEGGGGGRRWERRGEEEEDVRVKRRRIMQKKRGIGRKRPKEWGLRALAEERASKASALNLEEEENEVEEQKNVEKEMNVNEDEEQKRMMEVLNGIMGNEEERKGREFDEKQRNEEEEDDGKRKEDELRNEAREENEEAFGIMETTKLSHEEEEEELIMSSSSSSSFPPEDHGEDGEEHESALASRPLAPSTILDLSDLLSNAPPAPSTPPSPPSDPHPPIISPPPSSFSPPPLAIRRCAIYQLVCRRQSTTDRWTRLECPFPIGHFAICRHYLVICPKKRASQTSRPHFLTIGSMRRPTTPTPAGQQQQHRWTPLRLHADGIVPNEDGTRIWRISNGIGYSPAHSPDPICPSWSLSKCAEWCEMTSQNEGKLLQVALNSRHAWYLTDRGVFVQMCLPESGVGIWFRAQGSEDDPPAQFGQIAVSECAVWALNTFGGMMVVRTGLRHCPMGLDWVEMDGQPRKFVAIDLFERTGFGLDPDGCIWFIHGVAPESPFGIGQWLKCPPIPSSLLTAASSSSKLAPIAEWRLKVGSAGILLNVGPAILHTDFLSGSTFEHVVPEKLALNDHFGMLAAAAFSGMANDCLFASAPPNGDLFLFSMRSRAFTPLLPSIPNIRSIRAMPEWLFLLDNFGIVHFRPAGGNGATGNMAEEWNNFGQPAKFCSFGASNSSLWAISQTPELAIWACRFRPLDGFGRLDWMEISGPSQQQQGAKEKPDQIRVSPSGQSVWLFSSSSGLAWVRTDLAARNWRGRSWLLANNSASGIRIADLALSDDTAWALAKGNGQLYGLTNRPKCSSSSALSFIWRPFNFHLTAISVDSLEGRLWALDKEYRLVRHQMDIFPRETRSEEEAEIAKEEEEIAKHNHKWTRENWNPDMTRMLRRAWELPERTLSGESADSWCDLGRGGAI